MLPRVWTQDAAVSEMLHFRTMFEAGCLCISCIKTRTVQTSTQHTATTSGSEHGCSTAVESSETWLDVLLPFAHWNHTNQYCRRKFRSQTSDNMERWKSRGGKSQGGEEKKWEGHRRERVRRKKMQVCEKVGKSRFTLFFQWFVAPEGRKVTSLKRRVRSHLARWEMKNSTSLWREEYFEVNMYKAPHVRTTFGSWDVEKVHAVVARSTFPSQNVQSTYPHEFPLQNPNPWGLHKGIL